MKVSSKKFFSKSTYFMILFINIIFLILSIAFYTIVERKVLGLIIIRVGPNKPSFLGLLTPLIDAIKLLTKNWINLKLEVKIYTYLGPIISFILILLIWNLIPLRSKERCDLGMIWFISISGLGVYGIFVRGWGSDSKFSFLGSLRAVAQTISYEITLGLLLICIFLNIISFNIDFFNSYPIFMWWRFFLFISWIINCLIETNRAPFDLVEGESELVRGFNTEYGRIKFALLFLREYGIIIFLCLFTSFIFIPLLLEIIFPFICIFFIWARSAYPRVRYDILIKFIWKRILPLILGFLVLLL